MSTLPKGLVLRIIMPSKDDMRILQQLGPSKKLERREIALNPGRLTTEEIAKYIREFTRIKDETLHTIRLLGITRMARNSVEPLTEPGRKLQEYWKQLDDVRNEYHESQSKTETLEREIEDAKKKIGLINQVLETGFSGDEVKPGGVGFNRILGRIPTRRLEDIQKSVQTNLKDQVFIATGNKKGDWTYLLVAVPSEKTTQALQTLVLHDFSQVEIPNIDQPDLKAASATETRGLGDAARKLELEKSKLQESVRRASEKLNELADSSQEALIFLRAVLRIGEGATAEHAFTVLEKNPPSKALEALTRLGALVESE